MSSEVLVPIDVASEVSGVAAPRLRLWRERGTFIPARVSDEPSRPYGELFDFGDLVALTAIGRLEHDLTAGAVRSIHQWIRSHDVAATRAATVVSDGKGAHIVTLGDPQERPASSDPSGVGVSLATVIDDLERVVAGWGMRNPKLVGKVGRASDVMHNAWVVAGTRIPTRLIAELHGAGYDMDAIIAEYPHLHTEDVQAAIDHEAHIRDDKRKNRSAA